MFPVPLKILSTAHDRKGGRIDPSRPSPLEDEIEAELEAAHIKVTRRERTACSSVRVTAWRNRRWDGVRKLSEQHKIPPEVTLKRAA